MIKVGDVMPSMKLMQAGPDGPVEVSTDELFRGKRVVVFATPGAFTPTCSGRHAPGFLDNADALAAKGVDAVACVAVNDVFVMKAWAKASDADGIQMLADGNGAFAKALGLELDGSKFGMGQRSQRYAMVVDDGVATAMNVEDAASKAEVSGADNLLKGL